MVAAVNLVAGEAAALHRFVQMLLVEIGAIVTGIAQVRRRRAEDSFSFARMRAMAGGALAFRRRIMDVAPIHSERHLVVARITQIRPVFDQPQHAHDTVWLVARGAVVVFERLMFFASFELVGGMAVDAISFRREQLSLLDLRRTGAIESDSQDYRQ